MLKDQEERRRELELRAKYNQRITVAKVGRNAYLNKNYTKAIKEYTEYLTVLGHAKEVEDIFSLAPSNFDEKTPVSELLLISHVYWDLGRMYSSSPKFIDYYTKSLDQFVKFTANQPYQVLNSEMVRKFIKKEKRTKKDIESLKILEETYSKILSESNSCFIATYAFGSNHYVTQKLRIFKIHLLDWPFGVQFVDLYYKKSPKLIEYLNNHKVIAKLARLTIIPVLRAFAFLSQTSIFKLCSYCLKLLPKLGSNP
jgi:hypothetical protein